MAYGVLVVADQAMPRQLLEILIGSSEVFRLVACLGSTQMADLYCSRGEVDLILMDLVVKDVSNGIDLSARLKEAYPDIKIIIMTSLPDMHLLDRAREAGVESFYYKELEEISILELMTRTMQGECIFPDQAPDVCLGNAMGSECTERELEVLRQLVQGYTDKEIAVKLNMSYHTVRFHINSLLGKTGCSSKMELAIRAILCGIIVPEL